MSAVGTVEVARTRALLERYVAECPAFWTRHSDQRQCEKLWRHLDAIEERFGLARDEALAQVLAFAKERLHDRPCPVYVSGRGGSGSHWLAEMLGQLGQFADAGEVSVPAALKRELGSWPIEQQGIFVDCLHLLHAWTGQPYPDQPASPHPDIARLHVVNSNGDANPVRVKLWDPRCVFVHLIRDPRDQVLSMTYRKPGARKRHVIQATDDFLRLMLIVNRGSLVKLLTAPVRPDLVCRYEDLRSGAAPALRTIVERAAVEVDQERIDDVAYRHSAEARRQGMAPRGNLSRKPSRTWRDTATTQERLLMHAGLAEVVDTLVYEPDECLGEPLEFVPLTSEHRVSLPPGVVLGELHLRRDADGKWERAGHAVGSFTLPAGAMVRLRVPGGWTAPLSSAAELLPPGSLSSLCLAGNRDVVDSDLAALASFSSLVELDLARTRVSDACVQTVVEMALLRHVSVVGTAISRAAVDRLRESLPGCEVSAASLVTPSIRGHDLFDEVMVTEPPQ